MPPMQLAWAVHETLLGQVQPPLPSQLPLHAPCPPHSLLGSVPLAWGLQLPTEPARLHASQKPVQALSQHTPSRQKPLAHWLLAVQDAPLGRFAKQIPCATLQLTPVTQCAFVLQLVRQPSSVSLQVYGEQLTVPTAAHAPLPLQSLAVSVETLHWPFSQTVNAL
jgi:hypothetical protein